MRGFKEESLSERLERAAKARQAIIAKFKSQPGPNDPDVVRRREEQIAIAEARKAREAEKAERKAKEEAERLAKLAAEKAERQRQAKRAAIEAVIRGEAIIAELKAIRGKRKARLAGKL